MPPIVGGDTAAPRLIAPTRMSDPSHLLQRHRM